MRSASHRLRRGFRRQLCPELLEPRAMLANLAVTSAYLIDGNLNRNDEPIIGERMGVRVNFTTTNLSSSAAYRIDYTVNGVTLTNGTITSGAGYSTGTWWWYRTGWYASPDQQNITVTLDAGNQVAETNESDNTFSFSVVPVSATPPVQLIWPIEGEPFTEIGITNYVDVNPTSGVTDFQGGNAAYDGHSALDAGPGNFQRQDEGVELYAAAAGEVSEIHDGEFDRQTEWLTPSPPANYVKIDHGQGWETIYWHMRRDSIQVKVGQQVQAGDVLGYMGSSGVSTGSHVHFGLRHHGRPVEPWFDPETYFLDPTPYVGDVTTTYLSGVTNYNPAPDIKEGPSAVHEFAQRSDQLTYVWARFNGLRNGDSLQYVWRRPNGNVWVTAGRTINQDYSNSWWYYSRYLPSNPDLGTWTVDFVVNGAKIGEQTFEVTPSGAPELVVRESDGSIVIDNRYTPIDFGSVDVNSPPVTRTFTVENHGEQTLQLGDVEVPAGFTLVEGLTSQLAAGASDAFTVALDTGNVSYFGGQIRFSSNDADESDFNFSVEGMVTVPGQPTLTLGIGEREISETGRSIANIRRSGNTSASLRVNLTFDSTELTLPSSVTIPAGEEYATFTIRGKNDYVADGDIDAFVLATAENYGTARNELRVTDSGERGFVLVSRQFYNDSAFDTVYDELAVPDLVDPLFPGETATPRNLTNYVNGINGLMIDLGGESLIAAEIDISDFTFRTGRTDDTSGWTDVPVDPTLTVRPGEGFLDSHRLVFTWPNQTITNTWLEVTVKANEDTGLASDYVFYFGNQVGDINRDGFTNAFDFIMTRANRTSFLNPASIQDNHDVNRDARVNASDLIVIRDHATTASERLPVITPTGSSSNKVAVDKLPVMLDSVVLTTPSSGTRVDDELPGETFGGTAVTHGAEAVDLAILAEYPAKRDKSTSETANPSGNGLDAEGNLLKFEKEF